MSELEKGLKEFNSQFWNVRELSIERLAIYDSPELVEQIHSSIKDKYGHILFCRYLGITKNIKGLDYIYQYCTGEDEDIKDTAISSLMKYPVKLSDDIIKKLIFVNDNKIIMAVIDIIGENRISKYVPVIVEQIKTDSPEILHRILKAFLQLKDIRSVNYIVNLLKSEDEKLVCESINVLVEINNKKYWKLFTSMLNHDNANVRQTAAWGLGKSLSGKVVSYLISALKKEQNINVKQEILKRLSRFRNTRIIRVLTEMSIKDKNRTIRNMCSWLLENYDHRRRFKVYTKLYRSIKTLEMRRGILFLIGKLKTEKAFKYLVKKLLKIENPDLKSSVIESIGFTGFKQAIKYLEENVESSEYLISYTSLVAICKLSMMNNDISFMKYLDVPEKDNEIKLQTILQFFIFISEKKILPPVIWNKIKEKIYSKNTNIRYLSIQLLGKSDNTDYLPELLDLLDKEENSDINNAIEESIKYIVRTDSNHLTNLFTLKDIRVEIKNKILRIIEKTDYGPLNTAELIKKLLKIMSDEVSENIKEKITVVIVKKSSEINTDIFELFEPFLKDKLNLTMYLKVLYKIMKMNKIKCPEKIVTLIKSVKMDIDLIMSFITELEYKNEIDILFFFYKRITNDIKRKEIKKLIAKSSKGSY